VGKKKKSHNVMESAHQIWLAGLGAFTLAEKEGGKLFESLVKEGEKIEARTKKATDHRVGEVKERVQEVKERATDTLDGVEQVFEDRITRVLLRLGVPTHDDVQQLTRRVEEVRASIKAWDPKRVKPDNLG
jgi:poly(hydroxyalkanoate) granule-associated protein